MISIPEEDIDCDSAELPNEFYEYIDGPDTLAIPRELIGTTYYKTVDNKNKIIAVYRMVWEEETGLTTERYDIDNNEWDFWPDLLKPFIGLGDEDKYLPATEKEVITYIKPTAKQDELANFISDKLKKYG